LNSGREGALRALCAAPHHSALLSDFDGSLAEIVTDPALARPLPGMREILLRLSGLLGVVAVVSGRPASFLLDRLAPPEGLRLFGLYGLERVRPDGTVELRVELDRYLELLERLAEEARERLAFAVVEEKEYSLALHWRGAPEEEPAVRELATELALGSGLVLREAKMSLELLPPGSPDKGSVVRELAAKMRCVAYVGDDLGDLAAFDALDELEAGGSTVVRIAVAGAEAPDELLRRADLACADPGELLELLEELARRLSDSQEG
jgi:trehalose 6-phosphate phosphatase